MANNISQSFWLNHVKKLRNEEVLGFSKSLAAQSQKSLRRCNWAQPLQLGSSSSSSLVLLPLLGVSVTDVLELILKIFFPPSPKLVDWTITNVNKWEDENKTMWVKQTKLLLFFNDSFYSLQRRSAAWAQYKSGSAHPANLVEQLRRTHTRTLYVDENTHDTVLWLVALHPQNLACVAEPWSQATVLPNCWRSTEPCVSSDVTGWLLLHLLPSHGSHYILYRGHPLLGQPLNLPGCGLGDVRGVQLLDGYSVRFIWTINIQDIQE